jgi:lipopolysaccharide/colanic/teichoic acid biosynthesis glycosyltransferase
LAKGKSVEQARLALDGRIKTAVGKQDKLLTLTVSGDTPGQAQAFDILFGCLSALILFVPMLLLTMVVRLTSKGPALYWSDRVGRNNVIFKMPKFRSMRVGTPVVATHLLADARSHLTPIVSFLRKSSLDELPQLWSILAGDMSFVGPPSAVQPARLDCSAHSTRCTPWCLA